ncbi:MAG: histone H1 [Pelagibacteraceae bacterium]|nr:histone H1 [Pelagibacteraceae bacterium]
MSKLNELNEQIAKLYTEFSENHEAYTEKGNKAAGGRARKALGELKKLVTGYRKASVEHSKQ